VLKREREREREREEERKKACELTHATNAMKIREDNTALPKQ
jgi:hypothetical protein